MGRALVGASCGLLAVAITAAAGASTRAVPPRATATIASSSATAPSSASARGADVPSRCPATRPDAPPTVGSSRVDMVMVPIAAVRVDVCTYDGSAVTGRVVVVDGHRADAIENAANTLAGQDPTAAVACPPATHGEYVVRFDDGLHATSLRGATTGCVAVTNGFLTAAPSAAWQAALRPLLDAAAACAHDRARSSAGCTFGVTA